MLLRSYLVLSVYFLADYAISVLACVVLESMIALPMWSDPLFKMADEKTTTYKQ